jgi:hypothetical protein
MGNHAITADNVEIVRDVGKWEWSELFKKEDWLAIWLGFIILIVGVLIFLPRPPADLDAKLARASAALKAEDARAPFHTIEWHQANDAKTGLRASKEPHGKTLAKWLSRPARWSASPMQALYLSESKAGDIRERAAAAYAQAKERAGAALVKAKTVQANAAAAGFENRELNKAAEAAIMQWRDARKKESSAKSKAETAAYNKIPYLIGIMIIFMLFFTPGAKLMGKDTALFMKGFIFVFLLAIAAEVIGAQTTLRSWGFGPLIWAILGGMLIANTVGTPRFIQEGAQTEYFIKTGLVLLGAEILFGKILAIGQAGIFVAWAGDPHGAGVDLYFRAAGLEDGIQDPEHHGVVRYVRVRCVRGHCHCSGLPGHQRGTDHRSGHVHALYRGHDDRPAVFYRGGGHASGSGRGLDRRNGRLHRRGGGGGRLSGRGGHVRGRHHQDDPERDDRRDRLCRSRLLVRKSGLRARTAGQQNGDLVPVSQVCTRVYRGLDHFFADV